MTWRSTTAALMTWARYRLDGRPLRSTSDFGGTGGGAPHERGAQITDGYDRVAEVERAVLATFEVRPRDLHTVPIGVCRRVFLALTVGKATAKRVSALKRLKAQAPGEQSSKGWARDPGTAMLLEILDWELAADGAGIQPPQAALIVRVGLGQVTETLAARGLVPARKERDTMATSKLALRQARDPDKVTGWKEIGAALKVSARTAQRWDWLTKTDDPMPIKRTPTGYPWALKSELRRWELRWNQRRGIAEVG